MNRQSIFVVVVAALASIVSSSDVCADEPASSAFDVDRGGVVMTFDDRNFDDWVNAIPLFDRFGVNATFFISGKIDEQAVQAIRQLRSHGHAIGSHSVHHLKAVEYCQDHSPEVFLRNEIRPQLEAFQAAEVTPTSFAYPMSRNDAVTDETLLTVFRHLRTGKNVGDGQRVCDVDAFFVPASRIHQHGCLIAKGIDYAPTRPDRTFEQIDAALTRAAENNEILVFYAHRICATKPDGGHFVTPEALTQIFSKAEELKLPFYTFDQLP
nr:polysaccharide deacetylase family protein [Rhodopirellula sp. SM50]